MREIIIGKIEAVQLWINDIQQDPTTDPLELSSMEAVLIELVNLIQQDNTHPASPKTYLKRMPT